MIPSFIDPTVTVTSPLTRTGLGPIGITVANLAGTTNQVNLSASGTGVLVGSTNITLSLPQDIHTGASPTFTGLVLATDSTGVATLTQAGANADSFDLTLRKSRGTIASPTVITAVDELGVINFQGYSGAAGWKTGAAIKAISTATIDNDRIPAQISFWTARSTPTSPLYRRMTIGGVAENTPYVGIGTDTPAYNLDIVGGAGLRLRTVVTDATNKYAYITCGSKTNAEEDLLLLFAGDEGASTYVRYGGGSGGLNAVTTIQFYTAAAANTLTGTVRLTINSTGLAAFTGAMSVAGLSTLTGGMVTKTVNDSGPMTATNGTTAEIVFNSADSKFYGCTAGGTPGTWAALN